MGVRYGRLRARKRGDRSRSRREAIVSPLRRQRQRHGLRVRTRRHGPLGVRYAAARPRARRAVLQHQREHRAGAPRSRDGVRQWRCHLRAVRRRADAPGPSGFHRPSPRAVRPRGRAAVPGVGRRRARGRARERPRDRGGPRRYGLAEARAPRGQSHAVCIDRRVVACRHVRRRRAVPCDAELRRNAPAPRARCFGARRTAHGRYPCDVSCRREDP